MEHSGQRKEETELENLTAKFFPGKDPKMLRKAGVLFGTRNVIDLVNHLDPVQRDVVLKELVVMAEDLLNLSIFALGKSRGKINGAIVKCQNAQERLQAEIAEHLNSSTVIDGSGQSESAGRGQRKKRRVD